jgi:anti-sigma factor RsiW
MRLRVARAHADPLTCRQAGKILQAYLDGEVDELDTGRVAAHLAVCRRCGLDAEVYRKIKASLSGLRNGTSDDLAFRRLRAFVGQLAAPPGASGTDPGAGPAPGQRT